MPYFYLFVVLGLPPSAHIHHQQSTQQRIPMQLHRGIPMHTPLTSTHGPSPFLSFITGANPHLVEPHWESITLNLHFLLVRRVFKCILRMCAYLFAQLLGVGSRKTTCVHGRLIGNLNYINSKK